MNKQQLVGAAAILAIVGSLLIIRKSRQVPPTLSNSLMQGVSEAVVQEIGRLAGNSPKIVVVELTGCEDCVLTESLKQIFPEVARRRGISVVATEKVKVFSESESKLPADVYARVLQEHPDAGVVVSLAGLPASGTTPLPERTAKVLVIATSGNHDKEVQRMLDNKLVDAAIIPLTTRPANATRNPKTPREWFDMNYQVVTATSGPQG
jgi:hypothetical protein